MADAIREPALWDRLRSGIQPPMTAPEAGRRHAELFGKLQARRQPLPKAV
jgi:plasmid stabilization system protein ParE